MARASKSAISGKSSIIAIKTEKIKKTAFLFNPSLDLSKIPPFDIGMSRNLQVKNLAILVDGQNFISNIRKLFYEEVDPEDYLPRDADCEWLFRSSAKMLGAKSVSIYWYTIKELDFSPYVTGKVRSWTIFPTNNTSAGKRF